MNWGDLLKPAVAIPLLFNLATIVCTVVVAKLYGELAVFRKEEALTAERVRLQHVAFARLLESSLAQMRETCRHNAERRGVPLPVRYETWSRLLTDENIFPFDESLYDAARTLVIQSDYVNSLVAIYLDDPGMYGTYRDSIVGACEGGSSRAPYDLPATIRLVHEHLARVQRALEIGSTPRRPRFWQVPRLRDR